MTGGLREPALQSDISPQWVQSGAATRLAMWSAGIGAVLVAGAPVLGVARAQDGTQQAGNAGAALLAGVLALAVPLLAGWHWRRQNPLAAVGVLVAVGAVGVAAAVLDLQLFIRALDANRLELVRPVTAAELRPGFGAAAVLAGHLLFAWAGAVGLSALPRLGLMDVPDPPGRSDAGPGGGELPVGRRTGPVVVTAVGSAVLLLALALFLTPLTSSDPVLLTPVVLQAPRTVLLGTVLLAAVVLVAPALALVATSVALAGGLLTGVAVGVLGVVAPRLVVGALGSGVGVGVGSLLAVATATVLGGSAAVLARSVAERAGRDSAVRPPPAVELPALRVLHRAVGVAGVAAGAAAVLAWGLPLLSTSDRVAPEIDQTRVLLVAGLVLAAVCAGMFGRFGAVLRPVAGVAWAGVVLGGGGVLQVVLLATSVGGVGWGQGAMFTVLAGVAAVACGGAAGMAGAVERDDVDTSQPSEPSRRWVSFAVVTAIVALGAFGARLYNAPGFRAPALGSGSPLDGSWGWDTWVLLGATIVLIAAIVVAVRSRPVRGAAVLVGGALLVGVHLLGWPLTAGRVPGAAPGTGVAWSMLTLLLLLGGASVLAGQSRPTHRLGR